MVLIFSNQSKLENGPIKKAAKYMSYSHKIKPKWLGKPLNQCLLNLQFKHIDKRAVTKVTALFDIN